MSWNDAQNFIEKLNSLTEKSYRLPTEAEWEYAAMGGNRSNEYKFSGSNHADDVAWHGGYYLTPWLELLGIKKVITKPVGEKKSSEIGIYDMSGNVWEWCQGKWQGNTIFPTVDPYVVKGGSNTSPVTAALVKHRSSMGKFDKQEDLGFRIASDL